MKGLNSGKVLLILATSPAGLGHIRVTQALRAGLPDGAKPIFLGLDDPFIQSVHRAVSIHPQLTALMEWIQYGRPQAIFTRYYRQWLYTTGEELYRQLKSLSLRQPKKPEKLLIVATHFGLAHQLSRIKDKLERELQVQILLVVQVTDDSPQYIWYVEGADLLMVPSETTKKELLKYAQVSKLKKTEIAVLPYPVSPGLINKLPADDYQRKVAALDQESRSVIRVAVPVSGAAVGLTYIDELMKRLRFKSEQYQFEVISRSSVYTQLFLTKVSRRKGVRVTADREDEKVVRGYERVYQDKVIHLEVTKPSEQAFKALLRPNRRGGVIMLFSRPVGRQEYDNLAFLSRHRLMPTKEQNEYLYKCFNNRIGPGAMSLNLASYWRGLMLPDEPQLAAEMIEWYRMSGILKRMMASGIRPQELLSHSHELGETGVKRFWEEVADLILSPR